MHKKLKSIFIIMLICIISIGLIDVILSNLGFEPPRRDYDTARNAHPLWGHDLKPNLDAQINWGPYVYRLCTNEYGFASDCNNTEIPLQKYYDVAFVGDSFTEGIGLPYEETHVGLYAHSHPEYTVANLGVAGYSPSLYARKVAYYLEEGLRFGHLIVLPDISDIDDEGNRHAYSPGIDTKEQQEARLDASEPLSLKSIWHKHFVFTRTFHRMLKRTLSPPEMRKGMVDRPNANWTFNQNPAHSYGPGGVQGAINKTVEAMRVLKRVLDAYDIPMTVVVYPWPDQLLYDQRNHLGVRIWKEFCEQENCDIIDVNEVFFGMVEQGDVWDVINAYYIPGDFHFNAKGNQVIFETIDKHFTLDKD